MGTAYAAVASPMAQAMLVPRLLTTTSFHLLALPNLPPRPSSSSSSSSSLSATFKHQLSDSKRLTSFHIKASSEDTSDSSEVGEVFSDLKEKWDAIENKSVVVLYGGGAAVAVWLSSAVVGAINPVPVLPKFMELVGLGYTGWFIYRYLLFKSSRKELAADIEALKKKIVGTE